MPWFWGYKQAGNARKYFLNWYGQVTEYAETAMVKVANMLKGHVPNILTYCRHRITNAVSEGLNSKIQSIKSMVRGFRGFENCRARILFDCGKLDMKICPSTHSIPGRAIFTPDKKWVSNVKAVGRGKTALRYLARYVQRSAFYPTQLLGYKAEGKILLSWTSSSTGQRGVLKLDPHEFIRRWLIHVLPKGFTRVRHYGFLSSAAKRTRLKIRALLGELGEPLPDLPELDPFTWTECGGVLKFVREIPRLTPSRGPPSKINIA